jgi:hypothetical protein
MSQPIDAIEFTQWTDAQLAAAERFTSSPHYPALKAELDRRRASGSNDGSQARVDAFLARNRKRTIRRER